MRRFLKLLVTSSIVLTPSLGMADNEGLAPPSIVMPPVVCGTIASTRFYPYAVCDSDAQVFDTRQFPKSSGYPEDAATGIAATALAFGLPEVGFVAHDDRIIRVRQGGTMGRLSEMDVRIAFAGGRAVGCLLGGAVSSSSGSSGEAS
jgi:predicted PhzF superfamily epimerase YddE/YHI9